MTVVASKGTSDNVSYPSFMIGICFLKTIESTFSSTIPDLFSEKNIDHMADDISDFQIGNSKGQ